MNNYLPVSALQATRVSPLRGCSKGEGAVFYQYVVPTGLDRADSQEPFASTVAALSIVLHSVVL